MPTVSEIFGAMAAGLDSEKAKDVDVTVQFDLSGEGGGEWFAVIKGGKADFSEGTTDNPTATIQMAADDFVDMTTGKANAVNLFMTGKVKVEGDLNTVMKFQTLFNN